MSTEADNQSSARKGPSRVALVETVRLIILALSTAGGWGVGTALDLRDTRLSAAIALGALIGYVLGGVFGRGTAVALTAVERRFQRVSAAEVLAGTIGLILGLVVAFLVTSPLLLLDVSAAFAYPATAVVYLALGGIGYRLGSSKRDDFFSLLGLKPRAAGNPAELSVMDTSALIDGRVGEVVGSGFLGGTILIAEGVLTELRRIGDSGDPQRRERGRRGLEAIERLQRDPRVDVVLVDGVPPLPDDDVDAALVKLARDRRAAIVTNDAQLAKVAEAVGVPVRSVTRLTAALKPPVTVGQELEVRLAKPGRAAGQGVGYLEDGSMVVVEGAGERVGAAVQIRITNVTTNQNGRMFFAELAESPSG